MDRITDQTMAAVIARVEAAALNPPDDLDGPARAMFVDIANNNRARPWNKAHEYALADYCRVSVLWGEQMRETVREGPIFGGKVNPRFRAVGVLGIERLRLGKLLGLQIAAHDRMLGGSAAKNEHAREIGASLRKSSDADGGDLLS